MNWKDYISSDPKVMFGKPVIVGTRVPVDLLLEKLGKGRSIDDLLVSYPRVTREAIHACLLFAAQSLKTELTYAVSA